MPDRRHDRVRQGVTASVVASVLFGVLYLLPPRLEPLDAEAVLGWRVLLTVPLLGVLLGVTGRWRQVVRPVRAVRRRPSIAAVLVLTSALLGIQLWVFSWAPTHDQGLEVALGYFLMPLVMVVVGVRGFGERLTGWRRAAIGCAGLGVVVALLGAGGVSWATFVVAAGYPAYFGVRRRARLESPGVLWLELALLVPVAVVLALRPEVVAVLRDRPSLLWWVLLVGLVGTAGQFLYIAAGSMLPLSLFGLLTYLEPTLLAVVSVTVLGEPLAASEVVTYGAIAAAVLLLVVEAARTGLVEPATGSGASSPDDDEPEP